MMDEDICHHYHHLRTMGIADTDGSDCVIG